MNKNTLYHYRAKVVSVYDGDTCRVDLDLGFGVWIRKEKIRLARINTPEIKGSQRAAGLKSRDFLRTLILGKNVVLETIKDRKGKYGRYLGELWLESHGKWLNVNDFLVQSDMAEPIEY